MRFLNKLLPTLVLGCALIGPTSAALADGDPYGSNDAKPSVPTPEPGSALVFGVGLLIASQIARRNRR